MHFTIKPFTKHNLIDTNKIFDKRNWEIYIPQLQHSYLFGMKQKRMQKYCVVTE